MVRMRDSGERVARALAHAVEAARIHAGMTSRQSLLDDSGVNKSTYLNWMKNGYAAKLSTLADIAVAGDMTFAQFLRLVARGLDTNDDTQPNVIDAIDHDPTLTPNQRAVLKGVIASWRGGPGSDFAIETDDLR